MSIDWQRRAEAAERTVAVLKTKVRALYNGDQGAIQRQMDRARQREERMRARRAVMEAKNAALQEHSARLEAEVAQRTRDIQIILDNVTFGFLVIDRQAAVKPGSTRSCVALLGTEDITGRPLAELLGLGESAGLGYLLSIDEVFEDIMPEELTLAQIPGRFVVDGRVLQLEGRTIRDADGEVEALLMTISDITALEAARRESQQNKALVQILQQKAAFQSFLEDCRAQIAASREAVGDTVFVRRAVHTIKGNSASYGLNDIAALIHHIEEAPVIDRAGLDQIDDALRGFLQKHRKVLDIAYDEPASEAYEVTTEGLERLQGILQAANNPELQSWTALLVRKPASLLLGPIQPFAERLAERLGKEVCFTLTGADTLVDSKAARPVLRTLSHLVRNAVDHGIEADFERDGKSSVGTLRVDISEARDGTHITVSDDGRGIDTERLTARAVERGLVTDAQVAEMSHEEKLDLIFCDGLSSAETATDISGRGVGMSAVQAAVRGSGGSLTVETTLGKGTTFYIFVPYSAAPAAAA